VPPSSAIRFELVGDRFLRRQVRTLVSSALHAAREAEEAPDALSANSQLLRIVTSGVQQLTAHPAPPNGLVFADSGVSGVEWTSSTTDAM